MHLLKHCETSNGHVHVAVDLACTQAAAGHQVAYASAGGTYVELLEAHGVQHLTVPHPGGLRGNVRTAAGLLRAARRFRPDVLHAHMMTSAVLGAAVSTLVRAPLVTTVHNSFDRHSGLMRLGRVVVAVSESERRLLLARGYPAAKLVTVLNGAIGSPREAMATAPVPTLPQPTVATLCGLHRRKGVPDVIEAFATVLPEFPDWHLQIIGEGPDRAQLEALVRERGLDGSVHLFGTSLAPGPLLQQAAIFASGSLAEPFGLVVAEARAAGCAVVATEVGGVPEVLDGGEAGQLVPVSDPAAMAAVFRSLMGDPDLLQGWRQRARTGTERFTVQRMSEDYLRVYARARSRRGTPSPDAA